MLIEGGIVPRFKVLKLERHRSQPVPTLSDMQLGPLQLVSPPMRAKQFHWLGGRGPE